MQLSSISFPTDNNLPGRQFADHLSRANSIPQATHADEAKTVPAEEPKDLSKLKSTLSEHNITLKFSKDATTNATVVEMVDEKTGEEITQFPSAVSLKLAANFIKLQGHFVNRTK